MSGHILRRSGLILGTFEGDADGDAAAAFQRAGAIESRLVAFQEQRNKVLRDPSLDGAERRAAIQRLVDLERQQLAADAAFEAEARARQSAWRAELLAGSGDDELRRMEIRRHFTGLDEQRRASILAQALERKAPKDLGLLRALVADELTNEGLSGSLASFRAPVERLILELADPEAVTASDRTAAQLDSFASARAVATHYLVTDAELADHQRARRAADEATVRTMILSGEAV